MVAETAAFCLRTLQRYLSHQVVLWMYRSDSVLSSAPDYTYQSSKIVKVAFLTAPLLWGTYFLTILFYATALLTTGVILRNLADTGRAQIEIVVSTVSSSLARSMRFSVKLLALCALSAIILAFPLTTLALKLGPDGILTSPIYIYGLVLLFSLAIACFIGPDAIALLRPANSGSAPHQQAYSARVSASIAVALSTALSLFVAQARMPLWNSWRDHAAIVHTILDAAGSLIVTLPYVPLFIALYLIANPNTPLTLTPESLEPLPETPTLRHPERRSLATAVEGPRCTRSCPQPPASFSQLTINSPRQNCPNSPL
jgi:hypothetical protein